MTFLPFGLKRLFAHSSERARPAARGRWAPFVFLAALVFLALPFGARADDPIKGEVKAIADGGFVRLLFHFDEAVEPNVRVSGAIIVITFKKPVAVAVEKLNSSCFRHHKCCAPRPRWGCNPNCVGAEGESQHHRCRRTPLRRSLA